MKLFSFVIKCLKDTRGGKETFETTLYQLISEGNPELVARLSHVKSIDLEGVTLYL